MWKKDEQDPCSSEQDFLLLPKAAYLWLLCILFSCFFIWRGVYSDDQNHRPRDKQKTCYFFLTEDLVMKDFRIALWESTLKMKECLLNLQYNNCVFFHQLFNGEEWAPLKFNACVQMTHESRDKNISILRTTFWKSPWGYPSVLIAKTCAGILSNENLRWKGPYLSYLKNDFRRLVFSFIYWLFELSNSW